MGDKSAGVGRGLSRRGCGTGFPGRADLLQALMTAWLQHALDFGIASRQHVARVSACSAA